MRFIIEVHPPRPPDKAIKITASNLREALQKAVEIYPEVEVVGAESREGEKAKIFGRCKKCGFLLTDLDRDVKMKIVQGRLVCPNCSKEDE